MPFRKYYYNILGRNTNITQKKTWYSSFFPKCLFVLMNSWDIFFSCGKKEVYLFQLMTHWKKKQWKGVTDIKITLFKWQDSNIIIVTSILLRQQTFKSNKMFNDTLCICTLCVYAIQTNNYFAKLSQRSNQQLFIYLLYFSKIFDFK